MPQLGPQGLSVAFMAWSSWLFRIGSGVVGVLGVAIAALYIFQEKLLYVPIVPGVPADYWLTADKYGLESKEVDIETADGVKIHGWLLYAHGWTDEFMKSRPVILFFQENAGNMSFRLPFLRGMIRRLNCPIFAVSYRGYGRSRGKPSERGLKLDAEAGLRHLRQRDDVDGSRIVVYGRSLGGAVAIHLTAAYQDQVKALIIENTFTSVEDMVSRILPPLGAVIGRGKPLNFLVTNKWYSMRTLPKITKIPMLMIISGQDEMVPPDQMYALHKVQKARECQVLEIPQAHHMDAYDVDPMSYWSGLSGFIDLYA